MLTVVASAVSAFGLHIFVFGNSFAPSGIDGIATILQEMTKINAGLFTLILNLPLLIAAWFILNRRYVISFVCYIKSAYSTIIVAFGKVDILINGAGGNNRKPLATTKLCRPNTRNGGVKRLFRARRKRAYPTSPNGLPFTSRRAISVATQLRPGSS